MPETPMSFIIDTDDLSPTRLAGLLREFVGLLGEIDTELSPSGRRSLDWRITSLSYNSPAAVEMVSRPRRDAPDVGPVVILACIRGMALLETTSERPDEFNDAALEHVRRIADDTGNGTQRVRVTSPIMQLTATVTKQAVAHVERVLPLGYSFGSIEGRLEGLNIHGQAQFTIWDAVTGRAVRCFFVPEQLDDVTAAVGRKVLVSGRLRRDPEGRPQQIRPVDAFHVIDIAPSPPTRDPAGAFDFIDDPEEYLEMVRGG